MVNAPWRGKHLSAEHRRKISLSVRAALLISPPKKGRTPWWVKKGVPNPTKNPDVQKKISDANKRRHENGPCGFKKGRLNPAWTGGKGYEPYNKEYKDLRKTYSYEGYCSECETFRRLDLHHIDLNKKNQSQDNLILLCRRCHTLRHTRRDN